MGSHRYRAVTLLLLATLALTVAVRSSPAIAGGSAGSTGREIAVATGRGDQVRPAVTHNSIRGEYLVVWQSTGDIYAQRISNSGDLLGSAVAVCTESLLQMRPTVAYNSRQDEYLVVWQDGTGEEDLGGHNYIRAQRLSRSGARVGGTITIADATNWQVEPDVAYNSVNDQYLVVWRDGTVDVHGRLLDAYGNPRGGSFYICRAGRQQNYPAVAYSPAGNEYLVVWDDHRASYKDHYEIYGSRISASGDVRGETAIRELPGNHRRPDVACSSATGGYLVVWPDYGESLGQPSFYAQHVTAGGQLFAGRVSLSETGGLHHVSAGLDGARLARADVEAFLTDVDQKAAVAYDPGSGRYLVVWPDVASGDLKAGYLPPTSTSLSGRFTVCNARDVQREPAVAVSNSGGGYLIAWEDSRSGENLDIYAYIEPGSVPAPTAQPSPWPTLAPTALPTAPRSGPFLPIVMKRVWWYRPPLPTPEPTVGPTPWCLEPGNDSRDGACGPLVSSIPYQGTMESEADELDWFYFVMGSRHTIEAWLTGIPVGCNYDLVLADQAGNAITSSASDLPGGEHIPPWGPLDAGLYYLVVERIEGWNAHSPYVLQVDFE